MTTNHATSTTTTNLHTGHRCQAHHHGRAMGTRHVCDKPATMLLWHETYPVAITVCEQMADLAECDDEFQAWCLANVDLAMRNNEESNLPRWVIEWVAMRMLPAMFR